MAMMGRSKKMLTALACVGGLFSGCNSSDQPETTERVQQEALLGPCSKHADCEDGNPCTQNLCTLGACLPLPVLGCCFNGNCNVGGAGGTAGLGGLGGLGGLAGTGGVTAGTGGALPIGCSTDAQCQDGNPCTQNLCLVGLCLPLPVLGCCYQGVCEDGGSAGAGGEPPVVTGGCSTNEHCDDGNDCTQNLCVLGLCTVLPVLGCDGSAGAPPVLGCSTNEECEDGNDCIQNLCLLGLCAGLPVIGGVCGGEGGSGGTAGGGNGGSAGSTAGTAGNGGTAGSSAGSGGSAGSTAGTAGNGGSGGDGEGGEVSFAGQTAGGSGGSDANGGSAQGGSRSEAGESNGGSATAGKGSGATSTGASSPVGGEAGQHGDSAPPTEWAMQGGGCGCKVAGAPASPGSLSALLAGFAAIATFARRRRSRA